MTIINTLVEGLLDEAVAARLIIATGHQPGVSYGKKGFTHIKEKIQGFNQTAKTIYYLTLVDLMDTRLPCPPEVIKAWIPHRQPKMIFRVVEREIESWLLADHQGIAKFLQVNLNQIPSDPERLPDPKQALVNLARKSKSKKLREALIPNSNSTAREGKLYNSEMLNFINSFWNIEQARINSQSLDKCVRRLKSITGSSE